MSNPSSLAFRIRLVCCHGNETHAPIANPPNSPQIGGTPYLSPKLHAGPCSSVGMRRGTDRHTDRDTQTDLINIFRLKSDPLVSIVAHTDYATPGCCAHLRFHGLEPAVGLRAVLWTVDHTSSITCRYLPSRRTLPPWAGTHFPVPLRVGG